MPPGKSPRGMPPLQRTTEARHYESHRKSPAHADCAACRACSLRGAPGGCRACRRVCGLRKLPGVPREVLPALVHLPPRSGDAAVHRRIRKEESFTSNSRGQDREAILPRGGLGLDRVGAAAGTRWGEKISNRICPRRKERILFSLNTRKGPPPDVARGLRCREKRVVRHLGERRPPLPGRTGGTADRLERPGIHLQHFLLRLPRKPALDKLRSQGRQVLDHLG